MLIALLPLIVVTGTAILVMLGIAVRRHHLTAFALTVVGLIIALASVTLVHFILREADGTFSTASNRLLVIDPYALFFTGLLIACGLVIALLSHAYWERRESAREEFYILLLLGIAGGIVLVSASHLASFFLGIEIISVSVYAMAAYERRSRLGLEAALKYLVLAGVSSGFLLFGIALVYFEVGTLVIGEVVNQAFILVTPLYLAGLGMILVGIGFKLALFPFSYWIPDVYEGAPAVVGGFLATISKGAVFAAMVRLFLLLKTQGFGPNAVQEVAAYPVAGRPFLLVFVVLSLATMFAGNLLALRQRNLKRLLGYSSVAQMGYLLVALAAGGSLALVAVAFYLTGYFIAVLSAFGVVAVLSGNDHDAADIHEYHALAWRHPFASLVLTAGMLSLAGLPLTVGFVTKFIVAAAGVGAGLWALVIALVVNSGISLFYYLRVVREMYLHPLAQPETPLPMVRMSWVGGLTLGLLLLLLVWFGVYPAPILDLIQSMVTHVYPP